MKTLLLVISLFLITQCHAQSWTQLSDLPGDARDDGAGFVIGNKAYVGGGLTPWWSALGDLFEFDFGTEMWTQKAFIPGGEERQYASGFSHGSKGYFFGGYNGTDFLNDLWEYDPLMDSWTELDSLPDIGRSGAAAVVIGDTVYIIGGKTDSDFAIPDVWAYSFSSGTWQQKNDLPGANWRGNAVTVYGSAYLTFGRNELNQFQNELFEFDPQLDTWTAIDTFPDIGRSHAAMQTVNNGFYLFFGLDSLDNSYNDLWNYDLNSNAWSQKNSLPAVGRRGGVAFSSASMIYYTSGIDVTNMRLTETWRYTLEVGLEEVHDAQMRVWPNPTSELLYIDAQTEIRAVTMIDLSGRIVFSEKMDPKTSLELRLPALDEGVYELWIQTSNGITRKKLLMN